MLVMRWVTQLFCHKLTDLSPHHVKYLGFTAATTRLTIVKVQVYNIKSM